MARFRSSTLALIAGIALATGVAATLTPAANAQMRMGMNMGRGGFGEGKVSAADIEQFGQILGLDKTQADALKDLHHAYDTEYDQSSKVLQDKMEKIRQDFQDNQDPSVWQKDMPDAMEKFQTKTGELEKSFMSDLKALLTSDQATKWPILERTNRRNKSLPSGMLAGESVDLVKMVGELKLAKAPDAVGQSLDRYESEIDSAIVERDAKRKDLAEQMGWGTKKKDTKDAGGDAANMFDFKKIGEAMTEMRKSGIKVRDINDRYSSLVASGLPEDKREDFSTRYKKAKFPQIYREPYALKALNGAAAFKDLDADQKTGIAELTAKYKRDADAANEKYARATADAEKDGGGDDMMGGWMKMMGGDQGGDESDLAVAKKAKRKLDSDTIDKLKAILKPEQVERLPERDNNNLFQFGGGRGR